MGRAAHDVARETRKLACELRLDINQLSVSWRRSVKLLYYIFSTKLKNELHVSVTMSDQRTKKLTVFVIWN